MINYYRKTHSNPISLLFRIEPPTVEELKHNLAIIQTKKINAAKLDERFPRQTDIERNVTGIGDFPSYSEYEQVPGKDPKKDGTK